MPLLGLLPAQLYAAPGLEQCGLVQQQQQPVQRAPAGFRAPLSAPSLTFASRDAAPAPQATPAAAAATAGTRSLPAVANLVPAVAYQAKEKEPLMDTLKRAGKKALGGGIPGAAAMGIQAREAAPGWLAAVAGELLCRARSSA